MAYDEYLADRIRRVFAEKHTSYSEKKMMGGLCFMVDEKMCCGIHFDKKKEMDLRLTGMSLVFLKTRITMGSHKKKALK